MNRVPDRKQLRREYLRKKGKVWLRLSILTALRGSPLVVGFVFALHSLLRNASSSDVIVIDFALTSLLLIGTVLLLTAGIRQDFRHDFAILPYVPPITPSTLPPEEVLVRSAQEPPAPNETLLRAAVECE